MKKCLWQFITRKCKMLIIKSLLCVQEKKNLRNYMKTRRQKCNLLQNFGIRYCTCSWFIRQTQTSGFRLHRRLAQVCDVSYTKKKKCATLASKNICLHVFLSSCRVYHTPRPFCFLPINKTIICYL